MTGLPRLRSSQLPGASHLVVSPSLGVEVFQSIIPTVMDRSPHSVHVPAQVKGKGEVKTMLLLFKGVAKRCTYHFCSFPLAGT